MAGPGNTNSSTSEVATDEPTDLLEDKSKVVHIGAGRSPIILADHAVRHGKGIPGLGDRSLLGGLRTKKGLEMKVMSLCELQKQVLTVVSPYVQERWYADVTVSDRGGDFLMDPGATTSLISQNFYDSLNDPPPVYPTDMEVKVVGGSKVHSSGLIVVPVKVGARWYAARLLIMDEIGNGEDGILGIDWMFIHEVTMNMRTGKVTFGDNEEHYWARPEKGVMAARTKGEVTVLSNSFSKLELMNPWSVYDNLLFSPSGKLGMEERVIGSDCCLDKGRPVV